MNIVLLFLAAIGAISGWWLSRQRLTAKPWMEQGLIEDRGASPLPAVKIGLAVFLGVVGCLFALFFSAYFMRMGMPELKIADWRPLPTPKLLWLNTAVLMSSSVALQLAKSAAYRGPMKLVRAGLIVGGVFAIAFLAGQLLAWRQLIGEGYFFATNPANAFFYLISGVHGLHLLGGLVALGRTMDKAWQGFELAQVRLSVELCAIYWHFLLFVWLVFFGILLFA
jgi:cytochrome c oxidase subunit III